MDQVDPATLTKDLGGKWAGNYGTAPCPVCQPQRRRDQNALTISSSGDRLLLNCKKTGCTFRDLLCASGIQPGAFEIDADAIQRRRKAKAEADARGLARARSLWEHGISIAGTHGEAYLRGRGITCDLPENLRWVANTYHAPSGYFCSAMLASISDSHGNPMGIHRTFFTKKGERLDKAIGTTSHKMMLGPCRGGAVRLSKGAGPLVVTEEIGRAHV